MSRRNIASAIGFLLTPLREGRLQAAIIQKAVEDISTHAPAGGATYFFRLDCSIFKISTHAPAGGATCCPWPPVSPRLAYFYSRPCGRGDWCGKKQEAQRNISTHAPAGGATFSRCSNTASDINFYSRPCGRGDVHQYPDYAMADEFLLTPLREGRPDGAEFMNYQALNFYSRPCGRGDGNFPQVRHEVLRQIAER